MSLNWKYWRNFWKKSRDLTISRKKMRQIEQRAREDIYMGIKQPQDSWQGLTSDKYHTEKKFKKNGLKLLIILFLFCPILLPLSIMNTMRTNATLNLTEIQQQQTMAAAINSRAVWRVLSPQCKTHIILIQSVSVSTVGLCEECSVHNAKYTLIMI